MRPGAKVTIDRLGCNGAPIEKATCVLSVEVVYEKLIGTKMNDLDLCSEVVSRSRQPLRYI